MMLVLLLATTIAVSSCSKDDDDNSVSEEFLIGAWDECEENGTLRDDKTEFEVFHLIFQKDGKAMHITYDNGKLRGIVEFTWSLSGDKLTTKYKSSPEETTTIRYNNGILCIGDIYYKKK